MHMLFVDESGTPPPKEKIASAPYFVLGGVIIPEEKWHDLNNGFNELKAKYKVEGEIKWRHFAPQKPQAKTNLAHLIIEEKEKFRSDVYALLNRHKIQALCIGCDIEKTYKEPFADNSDAIYVYIYGMLILYFNDVLIAKKNHVKGLIICDNRLPTQDNILRHSHSYLLKRKFENQITPLNLIEGLLISPSHLSLGIQLSDMINGAVYRKITKDDNRFFKQIEGLIIPIFKKGSIPGIVYYQ